LGDDELDVVSVAVFPHLHLFLIAGVGQHHNLQNVMQNCFLHSEFKVWVSAGLDNPQQTFLKQS
jgi:hypothetical protein